MSGWMRAAALAWAFALAGPAAAQTVQEQDLPQLDPGLQQKGTQRSEDYYQERDAARPVDEPVIAGERPADGRLPEDGTRFRLRELRFSESAFIDEQRLRELAADYVGQVVSFADINELVARINDIYAERGIVTARALVPPQRIRNGVLQIRLVEGRLGELVLEGEPYTRRGFIADRLPLTTGEVVDVPALRRSMSYFNSVGNLSLRAALAPGAEPGESDVRLTVLEPPRVQAQAFVDNAGSETTGEERLGGYLLVNGPFGVDDRLTLYAVGSEGASNALLSYELPVNRRGGRLQARYAAGDIEIVQGPYQALNITGDSEQIALRLDQPFRREGRLWLDGYLELAAISSGTELDGSPLSDYDVRQLALGGRLRGFGAGYDWSLRQGVLRAEVEDVFGEQADYLFLDGEASYLRSLSEDVLGLARAGWQWSQEQTAPPTLLYQVGGVSTVRGYPSGALAGASGLLLSLEGRYRWRPGLQPFSFVDYGRVEDVSPARADITSVGIGLRWNYGRYLSGELAWGQTLDDVLPEQDSGRLHLRLAFAWPGQ